MKIGIIGFGNLNIMQYLYKYTNVLDEQGADYDVLYWNRLGIQEESNFQGNKLCYDVTVNTFQPFYKKIGAFLNYMAFARKTIRKNRYDKLIVLTTPTAMVLWDLLLGKYRGKYIYDYRDITKEYEIGSYKSLVRKLIDRSWITMMSSKGFLSAVQPVNTDKIVTAHNTHRKTQTGIRQVSLSVERPLRVAFWGMIRQVEHNKKLCDLFGNDPRFRVVYHGVGYIRDLEDYCQGKGYENISFTGGYQLSDIASFAEKTDILHCVYENDRRTQPTLAVKLYDALEYRLPILVAEGSYLAKTVRNMAGSFALEEYHTADDVYNWYYGLNASQIEQDYAAMEAAIARDDRVFKDKLLEFCQ